MPKRADHKEAVCRRIVKHLRDVGPKDWAPLMAEYPTISRRTFFRWIEECKDRGLSEHARIRAQAIKTAKTAQALQSLPAVPAPAVFTKLGHYNDQKINLLAVINQMLMDALLIREKGMETGPDGQERMRDGGLLYVRDSLKSRVDIVNTAVKIKQELFNLADMERYLDEVTDIIINEIGATHPEVRDKIIDRLRALNSLRMANVNVRPG